MKKTIKTVCIFLMMTGVSFGESNSYCVNQYNRAQQALQKVKMNMHANRDFYAKVEANVFQDYLIDLKTNCSNTKNSTIKSFLKDSKKMEDAMVTLGYLKGTTN